MEGAQYASQFLCLEHSLSTGWAGGLDLRLDNQSAVSRAGGLILAADKSTEDDYEWGGMGDALLVISDPDIWAEFDAWKRATRQEIRVSWHPGHPERRKRRDKSDWDEMDQAIFDADLYAEHGHQLRNPRAELVQWGNKPEWSLCWRGRPIEGRVRERLGHVLRAELLGKYVEEVREAGSDTTEWMVPELMLSATEGKNCALGQRVYKAKVLGNILGTLHTQTRRDYTDSDDPGLCRACGKEHETDSHVLWDCTNVSLVKERRKLVERVRLEWRRSGLSELGLETVNTLWKLDADGAVGTRTRNDLSEGARTPGGRTGTAMRLLFDSLVDRSIDPSGLQMDRAGMFGQGWVRLLEELGLDTPESLAALAGVSKVLLSEKKGTRQVWLAFVEQLKPASNRYHVSEVQIEKESRDFTWDALQRYRKLLTWHIDHSAVKDARDDLVRIYDKMETPTMTNEDRDLFVQFMDVGASQSEYDKPSEGYDPEHWDFLELCAGAWECVQESRAARGAKSVKVSDMARNERKCRAAAGADGRSEVKKTPRQSTAAAAKARRGERTLGTPAKTVREYPPRSQVVAVGRKKSNGNSGEKSPTETVMTQRSVNLDVLQDASDMGAETPRMKRSGPNTGAASTLTKRAKGLDQQQRAGILQAAYAEMDERRGAMANSEAVAQVQGWIKSTWLDRLTNRHGRSQAAVLWSWVADRVDAGDQAMRGIVRRERGASGSNADSAAPYWQEASRAEVGSWELQTTESTQAFADVEERQRQSRILGIIAKRLQQVSDPLRAPSWAIQWGYKSVKSKTYTKAMYDDYVLGLVNKGLLLRDDTIRPTEGQLQEMKRAGIGLKPLGAAMQSQEPRQRTGGQQETGGGQQAGEAEGQDGKEDPLRQEKKRPPALQARDNRGGQRRRQHRRLSPRATGTLGVTWRRRPGKNGCAGVQQGTHWGAASV